MRKEKRKKGASNFKKSVVISGKKGSLRLQGNYLGGDMLFSKM